MYRFVLLAMALISAICGLSQNSVKGIILGKDGDPISSIMVSIKNTNNADYTADDGSFVIHDVPAKKQILSVSGVGIKPLEISITVKQGINDLGNIEVENSLELGEVTVTGKTEARRQQEQAFAVSVMDLSNKYNLSTNIGNLTNKIAGVKIREEGGVGSGYTFTLNGFSGRQVKFFMDGLSMDNFGDAFSLTNLPATMVERVEIYKGVLPVGLGADALGGAVNIITRKTANYLDASYSFGSFNTHKASVNGAFTDAKTGFTLRANAFFNYSDNNYKVLVPIVNLNTGEKVAERWARRFHDGYKSLGARIETGVVDKPFADYLLAGIILSGNDKDIQNGAVMDDVYGARTSSNRTFSPSLRYKKSDLFIDGLGVAFYGAYSNDRYNSVDTTARRYNWLGEWVAKGKGEGERSLSDLTIKTHNWNTNTNIDYTFNKHHTITLNHVFSDVERRNSDSKDPASEEFKIPQSIKKHIIGLGWMAKYDRLSATVFGKYYYMKGHTLEHRFAGDGVVELDKKYKQGGYGAAVTYFVLPRLQGKVSYEQTYRLPEAFEMFGDSQENRDNPDLKPERSNNLNVGAIYEFSFMRNNTINMEANFLYRDAKDFIRRELRQPSMRYINMGSVLTKGVEATASYNWKGIVYAGANITYQYITDNSKTNPSETIGGTDTENFNYKKQLPNIPYLFGNGSIGFHKKDLFMKGAEFTIDYNLNYVKQYYLSWPGLGAVESKDMIPKQLSHDIAIGYSICNGRYNISAECNNISDELLYDNFKLQKPGRSFNVKFRYYIGK